MRFRRALRPDLANLLLDPTQAAVPVAVTGIAFLQDIDDSKKTAVGTCLGSRDFVIVEGPPGTGKTTFIAELVAQYCHAHPGARVLLASQTHVALDNALSRIREVAPRLRLIRVGRTERMSAWVEDLRLEFQLDAWRVEVLARGREFLREYARRLGLQEDVPVLVELRAMVPGITLLASSDRFGRFGCQRAQELVGAEQFCH